MCVKMPKLMKYGENTIKKAFPKIRAIRTSHGRFPSLGQQNVVGNRSAWRSFLYLLNISQRDVRNINCIIISTKLEK